MNNVYNQNDFYSARPGVMCFDNKGMVTPATSERTVSPTVRVNITDSDKSQTKSNKIRFTRRIRVSHILNGFLIGIVISVIILTEYGFMPATKLGYTCNDPSISHKYNGEIISPTLLGVGSMLLPFMLLLFTEVLIKQTFQKIDINKVWYYLKECTIGCALVLLITEVGKVVVGEHRPHFLDVCQPDTAKDCVTGTFIQDYTCTTTRFTGYFVVDSSRSFPSGHSSISVFVALFSAYIVQTRLPTAKTGRILKPFLISVCLTWGLLCSLTRITDRRHHWWDVLTGMTIGAIGALYSIYLVHKKISRSNSSPRISASTTTLLDVKNKDATSVII